MFVKLTDTDGDPVWINSDHIQSIAACIDRSGKEVDGFASLAIEGRDHYVVQGSPAEIARQIDITQTEAAMLVGAIAEVFHLNPSASVRSAATEKLLRDTGWLS